MTQHGTFENKPSQNIVRWLAKGNKYKNAHMIQSLEMASIVIHFIRGEPVIKVRRMLDVPGNNYINADHYCEQPLQEAVEYQPYRERVNEVVFVPGNPGNPGHAAQPDAIPPVEFQAPVEAVVQVEHVPAQDARPAIMPVRHQPLVAANQCLKHYLTQLYQKRVNLSEAEKFLNTFKIQKPKKTCSNYLDEFVINYENYAHLKWTILQLDGVEEVQGVVAQPNANPLLCVATRLWGIPQNVVAMVFTAADSFFRISPYCRIDNFFFGSYPQRRFFNSSPHCRMTPCQTFFLTFP